MKRPKPLEVDREQIEALRERAKRGELSVSVEDVELIEALAERTPCKPQGANHAPPHS